MLDTTVDNPSHQPDQILILIDTYCGLSPPVQSVFQLQSAVCCPPFSLFM